MRIEQTINKINNKWYHKDGSRPLQKLVYCEECGKAMWVPSNSGRHICEDCQTAHRIAAANSTENRARATLSRRKTAERNGSCTLYWKTGTKYEHRVVVEQALGRELMPEEVVHHIDGNKRNNSLENLVVMTRAQHTRLHKQLAQKNASKTNKTFSNFKGE